MIIKHAPKLPFFKASDGCEIAEVIHPVNDNTAQGVSLAYARVLPLEKTEPHYLEFAEIYYIISGSGLIEVGKEKRDVRQGDCVYVPPRTRQSISNNSKDRELVFLCVCHPAYDPAKDHNQP